MIGSLVYFMIAVLVGIWFYSIFKPTKVGQFIVLLVCCYFWPFAIGGLALFSVMKRLK